MNNRPLISVIIPCYNAEKFVEKSVRSIMEQTYNNLEIILINDCSTDNTEFILQQLALEDKRIVYIKNDHNLKLPKTLNKGIALAQGEYIARMDADDIAVPERLETQMNFMLNNPEIDLVGTNLKHLDEHDNFTGYASAQPTEHKDIVKQLAWKCTIVHPSILAKKSLFTELNGFDESIVYAEDYELWIRAYLAGKKFANLAEPLLHYRIHQKQMTSNTFNSSHAKIIRAFLYQGFKKSGRFGFIFGMFVQTPFFYYLINATENLRQRLRK
ncbi:glycosyl transferase [Canicola haemoglobinophilus]|uniref:Glycosyl transferase n=1 Tax=Canicola haemoglobinophilus TaxID=733 RepID=A0AB38H8I9_9PAST|nr:glycosyltransferase [Canicola haemoglobinophilus]STO54143.1 glycosyl transferase [Canicola haemoglobinophilus]STO68676.1 glycosyl transferase [Canicola haemoglobinophilus]